MEACPDDPEACESEKAGLGPAGLGSCFTGEIHKTSAMRFLSLQVEKRCPINASRCNWSSLWYR